MFVFGMVYAVMTAAHEQGRMNDRLRSGGEFLPRGKLAAPDLGGQGFRIRQLVHSNGEMANLGWPRLASVQFVGDCVGTWSRKKKFRWRPYQLPSCEQ